MIKLSETPFEISWVVAEHERSRRTCLHHFPVSDQSLAQIQVGDAHWDLSLDSCGGHSYAMSAKVSAGSVTNVAAGLCFHDAAWSVENYVLIPGAVYGGNRFHAEQYDYSPPVVGPDPKGSDRTPWVGDIPRLSRMAGTSHLDQQSIDGATPALAIYFPERRKALCLLTKQCTAHGTFGYEVIENEDRSGADILLMAPGMRHNKYFTISGYTEVSPDRATNLAEGDCIEMPFHLHWIDCGSIQALHDFIFEHRYDAMPPEPLRNEISFSAIWDILHEKHNRENWHEDLNLYQVSINQDPPNPFMLFQSGWVGGMITTLPMIQEGDARSVQRALRNIEFFLAGAQSDYGLFHEYYHSGQWFSKLKIKYDTQGNGVYEIPQDEHWTLVRRVGDVLFFLARQFLLLRERGQADCIRQEWDAALRRNVDAILDIWKRHGEFGQYIDVLTGEVKVAGSTAAGLIPAALCVAADYFNEPDWIQVAEAIAEKFRNEDLAWGVTTGGPGDCVQAPDSESIAALIESFILLYEKTHSAKWLQAAEDAAVQTASWALSYDYDFPEGSALHQIGAQSRGVFIANAQNKTGVPGICTLSGQSLLRVFRATGKVAYLQLLKEIAHSIPQYMGREDKRIPTRLAWGRSGVKELPTGWICERVNVTQWGEMLGEISAYSCWCEVAMMLTWGEIPGVYVQPNQGLLYTFDHIDAEQIGYADGQLTLRLSNSTRFDARVKIMAETSACAAQARAINFAAGLPEVKVPSGETVKWVVSV